MGLTNDALAGGFYNQLGYRMVGTIEACPRAHADPSSVVRTTPS